jgi:hypothetical protein
MNIIEKDLIGLFLNLMTLPASPKLSIHNFAKNYFIYVLFHDRLWQQFGAVAKQNFGGRNKIAQQQRTGHEPAYAIGFEKL